jgi:hypothetical protein
MADHPTPSEHARELVRGAVDYHVHVAPDFAERRITDVQLAHRSKELGLGGFGLKSHYTATHERAAVVREAVPGVTVLGTIVLNRAVGGLNALAVEVMARQGGRIVWFPTVSSENEAEEVENTDPNGKVPVWVKFELELRDSGADCSAVPVVYDSGELVSEAYSVLDVISAHDLFLMTGHLSRDEIFTLIAAATAIGVQNIVITHPEFPSQRISADDQVELAQTGALMERAFTTPYTGKCSWDAIFDATRAVGVENTVWATDLGQVFNPPVEDGLAIMADMHLQAGFTDAEIRTMAVDNTRRVAGV